MSLWIRPSAGLWLGAAAGSKDGKKEERKVNAGLVLGNWTVQLGLLLGGVVGVGERWGVYTGLMGAFALAPLLGLGFWGIPIGFHYRRGVGLGIIIPVAATSWWVGLAVGVVTYGISWWLMHKTRRIVDTY